MRKRCWEKQGFGIRRSAWISVLNYACVNSVMHPTIHPIKDSKQVAGYLSLKFNEEVQGGNIIWGLTVYR